MKDRLLVSVLGDGAGNRAVDDALLAEGVAVGLTFLFVEDGVTHLDVGGASGYRHQRAFLAGRSEA